MNENTRAYLIALFVGAIFLAIVLPFINRYTDQQTKKMQQYLTESQTLYNQEDYTGAERSIRSWLKEAGPDYNYAPGEYQLGRCLLQEGNCNLAMQAFQKAAEQANGYRGGGRGNRWMPADPVTEHKAQAAIAWIQQNPNWQPPPPGQAATMPGPPQDFPAN